MMKRVFLIVAMVALCAPLAFAQDWAQAKLQKSPRHGEWVTVKHGDRAV
jgi:carboxymethylenebutenolidase